MGQCSISHAVETAVSVSPLIRRPGTLAAHVSAVLCARAWHGEWLCSLDEPEWLLPAPVPVGITDCLLRVVEKGQTASLAGSLASFIDCQWPLEYLPAERPPG
jgi:hypothetical protein